MNIKDLFDSSRQKLKTMAQDQQVSVNLLSDTPQEDNTSSVSKSVSQESHGISNETAKAFLLKLKEERKDDPNDLFGQVNIDD